MLARISLTPIADVTTQAFMSNSYQLYHILEWILTQTGKAHVVVASFSTGEEFVRKIVFLKNDGLIDSCSLLLDQKAVLKTKRIITYIGNVFDTVQFAKIHAKVILIHNSTHKVCIAGSQNTTRGNRTESIIISSDINLYKSFENGIHNTPKITYNELFNATT